MPLSNNLDIEKWRSLKDGSQFALKQLFDNYSGQLYNYCRQFTSDEELTKDCIQELFIYIWTNRLNLGNPPNIKNYLYRAIRNNILRRLAYQNTTLQVEDPECYPFFIVPDRLNELIEEEHREQTLIRLNKALEMLTNRQREAIFLKFYENYSFEEIGEILEITTKASYKLLYRAIDVLKSSLSEGLVNLILLLYRRKIIN